MIFWKLILSGILIGMLLIPNAFAEDEKYLINSTTNKKLDVLLLIEPEHPDLGQQTKIKIVFLKPGTQLIQEHIDYTVTIEKNLKQIFETILTHTSTGFVTIPFVFDENGSYDLYVEVRGILFSPTIPIEKAIFSVTVGQEQTGHEFKSPEEISIPNWVKNNAGWWSQDKISDSDFVSGIQYLISDGIMRVTQTKSSQSSSENIPAWIKNNADWWSQGLISDDGFVKGIQYLVEQGIIKV